MFPTRLVLSRIYTAKRPWPPDFSLLSKQHQFRLEKRYRRRCKLKWARPQLQKVVMLAQWGSALFVLGYGVFWADWKTDDHIFVPVSLYEVVEGARLTNSRFGSGLRRRGRDSGVRPRDQRLQRDRGARGIREGNRKEDGIGGRRRLDGGGCISRREEGCILSEKRCTFMQRFNSYKSDFSWKKASHSQYGRAASNQWSRRVATRSPAVECNIPSSTSLKLSSNRSTLQCT